MSCAAASTSVGLGDLCLDLHGKDQTPDNMRKQLRRAPAAAGIDATRNRGLPSARAIRPPSTASALPAPRCTSRDPPACPRGQRARRCSPSGDGNDGQRSGRDRLPAARHRGALRATRVSSPSRSTTSASTPDAPPMAARGAAARAAFAVQHRRSDRDAERGVAAVADGPTRALLDSRRRRCAGARDVAAGHDAEPGCDARRAAVDRGCRDAGLARTARRRAAGAPRRAARRRHVPAVDLHADVVTAVDLDALLIRVEGRRRQAASRARRARRSSPTSRRSCAAAARRPRHAHPDARGADRAAHAGARDAAARRRARGVDCCRTDWNPLADDADERRSSRRSPRSGRRRLALGPRPPRSSVARRLDGRPAGAAQAAALRDAWDGAHDRAASSSESLGRRLVRDDARVIAATARVAAGLVIDAARRSSSSGAGSRVRALLAALDAAGLEADSRGEVLTARFTPTRSSRRCAASIARAALAERLSSTALAGLRRRRSRPSDRELRPHGARRCAATWSPSFPRRSSSERSFSPERLVGKVGQLSRELSRKRGGLKIRELFANYGPIIGEITPCLMMSPHSVARFLPAGAMEIDLVVFDEASQIKVAEAISAMGRGAATVVVGDSQADAAQQHRR